MDTLKQQKNRGYVIAGIGGVVAFVAFFLPYISATGTASLSGISWSGSTLGGALYFELLASLVAVAIPLVLIYRNNAFGLTTMPLDKQIRYGIFALMGAGAVGLLCELILAVNHATIDGVDLTGYAVGLGFGWWLYLLSAIAIVVGGVMALRNPQTLAGNAWQSSVSQYPYNQSYPPQSTQYPPYPPYSSQYPANADPEQYLPTEMGQPYGPTERRPMPQTGTPQYPNTAPHTQPFPPSGELPPPPPPPYSSQQLPPV
ncbi:MAG TPA: hypothetical protein VFQ36_10620 [Ktedonobacteraceae bacterium]|nr:hypothetical protein [Ktedonobacteraceae bacterium]